MKRHAVMLAVLCAHASAKPPACHSARAAIEWMVRVDAHTLRLCWQEPDACFALDLDAKSPAWTPTTRRKVGVDLTPPIAGVTVGMTVNLCGSDGKDCRDFVVPPGPVTTLGDTYALANADRSLIAAVNRETITLFDRKGATRGAIHSWKACVDCEGWSFDGIWFYGDRIYVEMHAGDKADSRVFDAKGAKIAELGDGTGVAYVPPLQLADGTIVVATAYGEKLDVRDKLGNRTKLVDVFGSPQSPRQSDRVDQVGLLPDGRVAVARGDGSVGLVDVATGARSMLPAPPACK
ncbi:MAG TPA: hypothetical protein VGG74_22135 [Kofleriaceae bacterium]